MALIVDQLFSTFFFHSSLDFLLSFSLFFISIYPSLYSSLCLLLPTLFSSFFLYPYSFFFFLPLSLSLPFFLGVKMKSEEEGREENDSDRGLSKYRYVILALCTSATFLEYATRANITNAIVSMVSRSHPEDSNSTTKTFLSDFCPIPDHVKNALASKENSTSVSFDEETFDWDPAIQVNSDTTP